MYETAHDGRILVYGPLCVLLDGRSEPYPRFIHPVEALGGIDRPRGRQLIEAEPTSTASIEIVEARSKLYHPTGELDSLEEVFESPHVATPVQLALDGDDHLLTVHDSVQSLDMDALRDDEVYYRRVADDAVSVSIDGKRRRTVFDSDDISDLLSSGDIEALVPLDITNRAYQNRM